MTLGRLIRKNPGVSEADADAYIEKHGEKWGGHAHRISDWNDRLLEFKVSSNALTKEEADAFRESDPFYVTMNRAFERNELAGTSSGSGGGVANPGPHSQRVTGSERVVKDLLENIIQHAGKVIQDSKNQQAILSLVRMVDLAKGLGKEDGAGWMAHRVSAPVDVTRLTAEEVSAALTKIGLRTDVPPDRELDMLTFFRVSSKEHSNKTIVGVKVPRMEDGQVADPGETPASMKMEFYDIPDKDLFEALVGGKGLERQSAIEAIPTMATRALRAGATGLRASFAMRNLAADERQAVIQSQYGLWFPGTGTIEAVSSLFSKRMRAKRKEVIELISAMGGKHSHRLSQVAIKSAKAFRRELQSDFASWRRRVAEDPFKAWEALPLAMRGAVKMVKVLTDGSEGLARIAEGRRALEATRKRWPGRNGETSFDAQLETYRAYVEPTLDFSRGGSRVKKTDTKRAFFNVGFIGLEKFGSTWRDRPGRTALTTLLLIVVPKLIETWFYRDDEEYQNELERTDFYGNSVGVGEGRVPIKGAMGPNAVINGVTGFVGKQVFGKGRGDASEVMWESLLQLSPISQDDLLPDWLKPAAEVAFNHVLYTGQRIDRYHEKRSKLPKDRVSKNTSDFAKTASAALPEMLDISPKAIDHLIRGYTGGMGTDIVNFIEAGLRALKGDFSGDIHRLPLVSSFYKVQGFYSGIPMRNFFKSMEKLTQKKGSGVATDDELDLLGLQLILMNGGTVKGRKEYGLRDIKAEVDAGRMTLKEAKAWRDNRYLPLWKAAEKRLAERKK